MIKKEIFLRKSSATTPYGQASTLEKVKGRREKISLEQFLKTDKYKLVEVFVMNEAVQTVMYNKLFEK